MASPDHSLAPSPTTTILDPTPPFEAEPPEPRVVTWDGPNDPNNPQNWSYGYKWFITLICGLLTLNVTFASSAPASSTPSIAKEFGSSTEVSYLITSMFLVGYVFGPMFWGPGSELVGRRPILVISLSIYTVFHLGQALAQNMETVIITRFFAGFFACAPLANSGGIIADIWDPSTRGIATSVFTMNVFLGPVLGPVVGSYITVSHLGWRWVFWVMMIFAGSCTLFGAVFLPETYEPVLLAKKAKRLRALHPEKSKYLYAESDKIEWTITELLNRTVLRPLKMLLVEPILLLVTIYLSVVYGVIYAMFEAFPVIFIRVRHFTIPHDGLVFIGIGIGSVIATLINIWFLRPYPQLMKEWRGFPPPEKRLYSAMVGTPLLAVSIFWLGWTGNYESVPWYVPALSTIPLGTGIVLVFMSFLSYLVDTYRMYSASAFAANTMVRSAVGAAFPLFTTQMFEGMGVNWASTLIGGVALFLLPIPFLFYKYGPRIRARSKFSPSRDLEIAKEIEAERKTVEGNDQV
ncbi:MFS polyamine transporter [Lactarius psammicola]|nr:MFS polyamine transporter [Lactarius psammicola]